MHHPFSGYWSLKCTSNEKTKNTPKKQETDFALTKLQGDLLPLPKGNLLAILSFLILLCAFPTNYYYSFSGWTLIIKYQLHFMHVYWLEWLPGPTIIWRTTWNPSSKLCLLKREK